MGLSLRAPSALLAGVVVGALALATSSPSHAASTVIGTEDPVTGFTGDLFAGAFGPNSPYVVASDGESPFQPFGVTFDVSDGLNFSAVPHVWTQAPDSIWTNIGSQTWVLPADLTAIGCGTENETTCEPVGHFISPDSWTAGAIGTWVIKEEDGSISDVIVTQNINGVAHLSFYSDPIPEPAALALLGVGLLGLVAARRRSS